MQRLILLRHGEAEGEAVSGDDFDRALSAVGRAEAAAMGRLLAVSGATPDLVLASSAVRTVQTFEALQPAFPKAVLQTSRTLYLASAREVLAAIRQPADQAQVLMVVGHNPGLHDLVAMLTPVAGTSPALLARLDRGFPTSAAAVFDYAGDQEDALLVALHAPRGGQT